MGNAARLRMSAAVASILQRLRAESRAWANFGNSRLCPICQRRFSRFASHGVSLRADARCYYCESLERHRFLWLLLLREFAGFQQPLGRWLHFAPERCLASRLSRLLGDNYLSADLDPALALVQADITNLHFEDHSFDVVICNHVLEHVVEDRRAISEIHRVLRPHGSAYFSVPIRGSTTDEDPTVVDSIERIRRFGQADHVRYYGTDFIDRLRSAGFSVSRVTPESLFDWEARTRYGLTDAAEAFHIAKPRGH